MLVYRVFIVAFSLVCSSTYCSWILVVIYLLSSSVLTYQYFMQIPYYNSLVSVFFGSLVTIYFWISINAVAMKLFYVDGHIIVISLGIPIIVFLVKSLRAMRIDTLVHSTIDKLSNDIDALIQITIIAEWSIGNNGIKSTS
jgi:hypothetical protein